MSERTPLIRTSSTTSDGQNVSSISTYRGIAITTCIFLLIFLSTCNVSVLTTIQSSIAIDLNATTQTSWFTSALLISSASITPVAGKLSQVLTERIYLLCSVCLQAVGLLISGFSTNVSTFLAGRAVYGSGVAALAPVALILIKDHAPEKWQGLFFGLVNCAYTTGVACGAVIGGALEPAIGWRAVFWGQSPIIVLLAAAAFFSIPNLPSTSSSDLSETSLLKKLARLDYFGILTLVTSAVFLLYSLSAPSLLVTPIVLSIASLLLFIFVETKWANDPIIPPTVLRSRGAMLTGLATVGVMSARWGVLFYMPTYGIAVRQWSLERSGSLLIPTNAGFGTGGVVVGLLHVRRSKSYYVPAVISCALFAASMFSIAVLANFGTPVWLLIVALFVNGFVVGAFLNYSLAHVLFLTAPQHRTAVIPVTMMFRNLAGAVGSSLAGGIFLRSLNTSLAQSFTKAGLKEKVELITQLLARPMLVQKLQGIEKSIAISSYASSLRTLYYASTGFVVIMLILQAGTGWKPPQGSDDTKQHAEEESLPN